MVVRSMWCAYGTLPSIAGGGTMRVSEERRRTLFELLRDHLDEETAPFTATIRGYSDQA